MPGLLYSNSLDLQSDRILKGILARIRIRFLMEIVSVTEIRRATLGTKILTETKETLGTKILTEIPGTKVMVAAIQEIKIMKDILGTRIKIEILDPPI
jgi:hypothetical protein